MIKNLTPFLLNFVLLYLMLIINNNRPYSWVRKNINKIMKITNSPPYFCHNSDQQFQQKHLPHSVLWQATWRSCSSPQGQYRLASTNQLSVSYASIVGRMMLPWKTRNNQIGQSCSVPNISPYIMGGWAEWPW